MLDGILQRLRFRGPDARNIFVERDFACCCSFLEGSPPLFRVIPSWTGSAQSGTPQRLVRRACFLALPLSERVLGDSLVPAICCACRSRPPRRGLEKGAQEGRWWLWNALLRPTTDQEIWAGGHRAPPCLNRKATKKPARDDHGPAPEELFSSTTDSFDDSRSECAFGQALEGPRLRSANSCCEARPATRTWHLCCRAASRATRLPCGSCRRPRS